MREWQDKTPRRCVVGAEFDGQRLDNYLLREWRGVPRSLVYRLIRSGNVRVNAGRARPDRRLQAGDHLRLPASVETPPPAAKPAATPLELQVLHEDAQLLVVDKPAGLAVHGGSGVAHGVIERLRAQRPPRAFLELVHRLDRDTSGALLLAKKRSALVDLQRQWRAQRVEKRYIALVLGQWRAPQHRRIDLPLARRGDASGARQVVVDAAGKSALTRTALVSQQRGGALVQADIRTGRTHQLRVHFAQCDLPILGDGKYGDFAANRAAARAGLARMFLHAAHLAFTQPASGQLLAIAAPLPPSFAQAAQWLENRRRA